MYQDSYVTFKLHTPSLGHPLLKKDPVLDGANLGNLVTGSPRFFPVTIDGISDPGYQEVV